VNPTSERPFCGSLANADDQPGDHHIRNFRVSDVFGMEHAQHTPNGRLRDFGSLALHLRVPKLLTASCA
jgi:hypothetical protein